jgi:hypothetical protein
MKLQSKFDILFVCHTKYQEFITFSKIIRFSSSYLLVS